MKKLSSTTLFHFTPKFEFLKSILEHGFFPRYSTEKYLLGSGRKGIEEIAIPMVCFCDIPLSQTMEHMDFYGCYSIGLSKDWIFRNKVSPVQYSYPNSSSVISLIKCMESFNTMKKEVSKAEKEFNAKKSYEELSEPTKLLANLTYQTFFIKDYEGESVNKKGKEISKRFYDEKEWRYIPSPRDICGQNVRAYIDKYISRSKNKANSEIAKLFNLKIEPNDIKYIIVEKPEEIGSVMKLIDDIYQNNSFLEVVNLKSRILDSKRIKDDF